MGDADELVLVSALIATTNETNSRALAATLLRRHGGLGYLLHAASRSHGYDPCEQVAYARLATVVGTINMLQQQSMSSPCMLSSPLAIAEHLRSSMAFLPREEMRVLFLDAGNRLRGEEAVALGTTSASPVYPREIARRALELAATSVILAHNHPSGSVKPSREDIDTTRQVIETLNVFSIAVLDHLIVARGGWLSMRSEGLM